ncbi:unnamed protein product, partial [Closterium sp. NIES-54]
VGCKDLTDTELYGWQDPYVVLQYGSQCKRTATHKDGHTAPQWNETVRINYQPNVFDLAVGVWNENTFSQDSPIGGCKVSISQALDAGVTDAWHPLYTSKQVKKGSIRLIIKYHPYKQLGATPLPELVAAPAPAPPPEAAAAAAAAGCNAAVTSSSNAASGSLPCSALSMALHSINAAHGTAAADASGSDHKGSARDKGTEQSNEHASSSSSSSGRPTSLPRSNLSMQLDAIERMLAVAQIEPDLAADEIVTDESGTAGVAAAGAAAGAGGSLRGIGLEVAAGEKAKDEVPGWQIGRATWEQESGEEEDVLPGAVGAPLNTMDEEALAAARLSQRIDAIYRMLAENCEGGDSGVVSSGESGKAPENTSGEPGGSSREAPGSGEFEKTAEGLGMTTGDTGSASGKTLGDNRTAPDGIRAAPEGASAGGADSAAAAAAAASAKALPSSSKPMTQNTSSITPPAATTTTTTTTTKATASGKTSTTSSATTTSSSSSSKAIGRSRLRTTVSQKQLVTIHQILAEAGRLPPSHSIHSQAAEAAKGRSTAVAAVLDKKGGVGGGGGVTGRQGGGQQQVWADAIAEGDEGEEGGLSGRAEGSGSLGRGSGGSGGGTVGGLVTGLAGGSGGALVSAPRVASGEHSGGLTGAMSSMQEAVTGAMAGVMSGDFSGGGSVLTGMMGMVTGTVSGAMDKVRSGEAEDLVRHAIEAAKAPLVKGGVGMMGALGEAGRGSTAPVAVLPNPQPQAVPMHSHAPYPTAPLAAALPPPPHSLAPPTAYQAHQSSPHQPINAATSLSCSTGPTRSSQYSSYSSTSSSASASSSSASSSTVSYPSPSWPSHHPPPSYAHPSVSYPSPSSASIPSTRSSESAHSHKDERGSHHSNHSSFSSSYPPSESSQSADSDISDHSATYPSNAHPHKHSYPHAPPPTHAAPKTSSSHPYPANPATANPYPNPPAPNQYPYPYPPTHYNPSQYSPSQYGNPSQAPPGAYPNHPPPPNAPYYPYAAPQGPTPYPPYQQGGAQYPAPWGYPAPPAPGGYCDASSDRARGGNRSTSPVSFERHKSGKTLLSSNKAGGAATLAAATLLSVMASGWLDVTGKKLEAMEMPWCLADKT